ncbi:glycoside hydrolase family 13 protein [Tetragenococcus koreensis]|uniref:Amylopullulanase n=1 Tax=Tetragenococcus koreensis TaxID=290335 RepID=A0AAN4RJL3_9ENTE|nr:glycoside hydrolase family 13 protein [Tetragenococcus koreensis]AYW45175.1 alpha-glycosidase [Tetragenococcus koreensis]MDN6664051.1 glycoside hydrolase family 13 protein [Tetragenococcus koreensis]GEN91272.1 alpha-amylase [Tetragenococcus koreensis]GEQ49275.1 amylopullulanase [Tetragenococcus koreensis]GEQ51813.1 amylopullulanase [Tetragenococcus koreensis]
MAVIRFNPWKKVYKKPFGAVKENEVAIFMIEVIAEKVVSVQLIIHKDFQKDKTVNMSKTGETEFSCEYFFNHQAGLYFYHFEVQTQVDDEIITEFYGPTEQGGEGQKFSSAETVWDYQVTCYKRAEKAPDWYRNGIFYQIFPDRFANGNPNRIINSPKKNTYIYATEEDEPLYVKGPDGEILRWDFFGGNFKGILQKIPYLKELGVNGIYLNPIFEASSNHRYDTADYFSIDPVLGTQEEFKNLLDTLHENEMHLILDGVFSHVGQNSRYFNVNGTYGENTGAYNDRYSPYYSWFTFNDYPDDYASWWGIKDLPEVNKEDPGFQKFIYGKEDSVLSKWTKMGVDGWRLDVADELPDEFIKGIRGNLENFSEKILLGEVWEDASNKISYNQRREYILGDHLQGVMNYPLRNSVIDLLSEKKSPKIVAMSLMKLYENYPVDIFFNNLNNIGTHDTERILSELGHHLKKMDLAFAMMFIFPGIPCIYYGDEAGLTGGKDPENRKFFPWETINQDIYDDCKKWVTFRKNNPLLKDGEVCFFYGKQLFGILRYSDDDYVALLINPGNYPTTVNGNLTFISDETSMVEEVHRRLSNRTLKENSYLLITSEQKRKSIEKYRSITKK